MAHGGAFDLRAWLMQADLVRVHGALAANEVVTVQDLLDLSDADLRELVPQIGTRNRLARAIGGLRGQKARPAAAAPQKPAAAAAAKPAPPSPAAVPATPGTPKRVGTALQPKVANIPPRPAKPAAPAAAHDAPGQHQHQLARVQHQQQQQQQQSLLQLGSCGFGVDVRYVADRKRREAERAQMRKHNLLQERERWLQLLKRTVSHPHVDSVTEARRKEAVKLDEARRRSLSRSISLQRAKKTGTAAQRTASCGAARRTRSGSGSRGRRPSDSELRDSLYEDLASAYTSLADKPLAALSSPNRRRVWCRGGGGDAPAVPDAAQRTPSPGVFGNGVGSPSPPPPPGSPSPLAVSPHARCVGGPRMPQLSEGALHAGYEGDVFAPAPQHASSPEQSLLQVWR